MKHVFADTLFWVASIRRDDSWHHAALRAASDLVPGQLVVTTEEVLSEFLTALAGCGEFMRREAQKTVHAILSNSNLIVKSQTHESFMAGLDFYGSRADKAYSLVDCISMQTMYQMGITDVLTNDRHFTQEGFKILITRDYLIN